MKNSNVNKILEGFLIIVILLIAITGQNKLIYAYKVLIALFAIIPFFIINNKRLTISIKKENIGWIILYLFFAFSIFYTIDMQSTLYFLVIYLCGFLFLYHRFNEEFWDRLLKTIEIVAVICAITILLEQFLPNIFESLFGWFGNQVSKQYDSSEKGYYSGILFEGARAAFIVNIGIAISYSKILTKTENKYLKIIEFIILSMALLLTGKRTLTAVGIALMFIIYLINNKDKNRGKIIKLIIITAIAVALVVILSIIIPDIVKPFERMSNIGDTFGGRKVFWETCMKMFNESPVIGKGLGTFNQYLADTGFTYYGKQWTSYAHNSYLQILGETGIIASLIIVVIMGCPLIKNFKILLKQKEIDISKKQKLLSCLYVQLLFLLYALTGNPFHNFYEIYMYLIFINFVLQINLKKEISDKKND